MGYSKSAYDVSLDELVQLDYFDLSVRFGFCPLDEKSVTTGRNFLCLVAGGKGPVTSIPHM